MTMNLEKKPPKGGMPMTEKAQKMKATAVQGMVLNKPPIWRMSRWWVAWMTMPAQRKRPALARPCIRMNSSEPAMPTGLSTEKPRKM